MQTMRQQCITWESLVACPEIAELVTDCESVARHARWDWYPRWLHQSKIFRDAVDAAAERLGASFYEVRPVALAGLLDTYHEAQRRTPTRHSGATSRAGSGGQGSVGACSLSNPSEPFPVLGAFR